MAGRTPLTVATGLLLGLTSLTACGGGGSTSAATTGGSSGSTGADSLHWSSCHKRFQCAHLTVPLDATHPGQGTISLALIRLPAGQASRRIGSMLVNPGGPGVAGSELVLAADSVWPTSIRDRFDIVSWDPRGTGDSSPVDCVDNLDATFSLDATPDSPAARQALVDAAKAFDAGCEARSGKLLAHISTVDTAGDMERIRVALGDERMTYFGFSYGSELGATYATLHPDRVRAMVLDGAISPDTDTVGTIRLQAKGAEVALDDFLADCSRRTSCAFHNGGDAAGAYDRLMAALDARPIAASEAPASRPLVGQGVAAIAVTQALYSTDYWPNLAQALADAAQGDGAALLSLYDDYLERNDDGTWSNSLEDFEAISCLDDPAPHDLSTYDALFAELRQSTPRIGVFDAYDLFCAFWPVPSQPGPAVDATGAPPILVVASTRDPYTPYDASVRLAQQLKVGVVLTRDGDGHTAYGQGNGCIDQAVDAYLLEGRLPTSGTVCR